MPRARSQKQRLEAIAREYLPFVWRVLRRLGLAPADADDAAQRVLMTVARRDLDGVAQDAAAGCLLRGGA